MLLMYFILSYVCWSFFCLFSDLFSTILNLGFCIPGSYLSQAPLQTSPNRASNGTLENERREEAGLFPPLPSVLDGVWQHLAHVSRACCTTLSPWFLIYPGNAATVPDSPKRPQNQGSSDTAFSLHPSSSRVDSGFLLFSGLSTLPSPD